MKAEGRNGERPSIEEGTYLFIERIMSVRGGGRPGISSKVDILLRFESDQRSEIAIWD